ncbi:ABC transporter permease subunit [Thiomicrospira sp. ALE5]|uniref:ABC transporter permease subunit n=1 Tax=Thiomicrospira sp. ALE5 TaxID=748650 RepID=UPI0008DEC81E|nr:ABC transporter permease subunit [Thiomicrospira sp. ALE5]SFR53785.1 phosphate transport system permease protein [Thiomicrospira sp. ALE5]
MSQLAKDNLNEALTGQRSKRRLLRRRILDHTAKYGISSGGIGIIFAVFLIMFFLIYVVLPMFVSADIDKRTEMLVPGGIDQSTVHYAIDDYKEVGVRITDLGQILGFSTENADVLLDERVPVPVGTQITSFTLVDEPTNRFAFGLGDGGVILGQIRFELTYPDGQRVITPVVDWPFGEEPKAIHDGPVDRLAVRDVDERMMIVAQSNFSDKVSIQTYTKRTSFISDEIQLRPRAQSQISTDFVADYIMLARNMRDLVLVARDGLARYYQISNIEQPELLQQLRVVRPDETITTAKYLNGNTSMLFGTDKGRVVQWFPVRDRNNDFALQEIRDFSRSEQPITAIGIEGTRRGLALGDNDGQFNLFYSTSERHLKGVATGLQDPINFIRFAPRENGALVETQSGRLISYDIHNPHPQISFSSLWKKVWYEGYSEPTHTWQSTGATDDFEGKMSLTPLTFGTIKAALYSMLFAVPIAIFAAIYTAFFMDKKTRQWIKPSVELIEALPTVILGFLAGLWLAPYMEANLPGFFAIVFVVPIGILLFGYGWSRLPEKIRLMVPIGRRAVLMLPVVIFLGWFALSMSVPIERMFFNGDMRDWLTNSAGIDFDQRNAMVIGFAMGFALIPTIFSVAEDAIYSVPRYLVNGSYALGASGWQTMVGVVLPTASPGIFSAVMLGFGRGVGETMIVLMASGNTPLMDVNIFEGMRTLAANLAVEMAETEVDSTHYRVLFLSGLVLFIFTFFFNTLAEIVRQRMRKKYGSL